MLELRVFHLFQNQAFHCSNFQLASFNVCEQLQKLTESLEKQREGSNNEGESDNRDSKGKEAAVKQSRGSDAGFVCPVVQEQQLEDTEMERLNYVNQDEIELVGAPASTSLTSTEQECCFDCTSLPDQQWWEFWPMTE